MSRVLWATGLCRVFSVSLPHQLQMRFFPSSVAAGLWADPSAWREEEELILGYLRTGDTYIDVGANVGLLTLLAARRVGASGSVIAIEPHPRTFGFLRENVRLNGLTQVQPIHAAAGNSIGATYISDFRADDMNHLNANAGIKVPLITLDSLNLTRRVALLKTDTEGFEPFVFEGARDLLPRVDSIYFECSEWNLSRYGRSSRELRAMLKAAGFSIYRPRGDGLLRVSGAYDAGPGGNLLALRES